MKPSSGLLILAAIALIAGFIHPAGVNAFFLLMSLICLERLRTKDGDIYIVAGSVFFFLGLFW
jgi:hypothetical protein